MSTHQKKYILWMVGVPIFAILFGLLLVDPGPVSKNSSPSTTVRGGRSAPSRGSSPSTPATARPAAPAQATASTGELSYSELRARLVDPSKPVKSVTFRNGTNVLTAYLTDGTQVAVTIPEGARADLIQILGRTGVTYSATEKPAEKPRNELLYAFGPTLVIGAIILIVFFLSTNRQQSMLGGFGKSKARSASDLANGKKITFADVGGCDEAVRELMPVAKGLKRRHIYAKAKAKLPKGILLIGPPGTGKTLLAKATAAECDGTASIMSGSDFVEMLVGVGASRVRDEFRTGREIVKKTQKPRIIFIDEIDAIGGKRGGGTGANRSDEREQTLNALLVEMDGVEGNDGLIVMAATNRPDILDEALLRPGRFDCQILIDRPDKRGREVIFGIHLKGMPVEGNVTAVALAERTYGYSGADIAAICNKAGLIAADRLAGAMDVHEAEHKSLAGFKGDVIVTVRDFDEAIDFVKYGAKRDKRQETMREEDKRNTAIHEAGHACVANIMPEASPIVKITIMSRSRALGYVQQMPSEDQYSFTKRQAVARIVTMMAGRAAQEEILGTCDTGAQNDFEQATELARKMVLSWGMSRLGPIAIAAGGSTSFSPGFGGAAASSYGPELANEIDREWRRINDECMKLARQIVKVDRARLEALAANLLDKETILKDEWTEFAGKHPSQVKLELLNFDPAQAHQEQNHGS